MKNFFIFNSKEGVEERKTYKFIFFLMLIKYMKRKVEKFVDKSVEKMDFALVVKI